MSRAVRKELLKMIDLLDKANRALKASLKKTPLNEEGIIELLADCQETALAVGEEIEGVKGEGTKSVAELEEYCETLYQMALGLKSPAKRQELLKDLENHMKRTRNKIEGEVPDRLEVVFLPYKASMWDSLESVWMAAEADEECDAYVIPIPYYDKNPDGSFRREHYEAAEYPDYVPVISYDEYDFSKRHPDIIFIHNPYDEYNYVTTVHPFFYSKNLKEYTDKLVYIPYFVLDEVSPDDRAAVDDIRDFLTTPGVIHADTVIVQSENMRKVYIDELLHHMGDTKENRRYLENKILGLGSPKVDRVIKAASADIDLPEEWRRIIMNPDGSRKKVIFYNTSVSALLEYDEKMLRKIEAVLEIFKMRREDAALLWRPHPLIQATIESMRPHLWQQYKEIVDQYKAEGWGIYDDTADMDRAVAISDAYYGDPSSLVRLCAEAKIPVVIQNVNSIETV